MIYGRTKPAQLDQSRRVRLDARDRDSGAQAPRGGGSATRRRWTPKHSEGSNVVVSEGQDARPCSDWRRDRDINSRARRRRQDSALRLSRRIEVRRPLSDQRELQPQRQRSGLRRARSLSTGPDVGALPCDELGSPRSVALALSSAKGRQIPRRSGFHGGRRHLLRPSRHGRGVGSEGRHPRRRRDREGRRLYRRLHPQETGSAADQSVANLGHFLEELVGGSWRDRSHRDERHDAALCRASRQRHRALHSGQP